jgi:hypothetical protein
LFRESFFIMYAEAWSRLTDINRQSRNKIDSNLQSFIL